MRLELGEEDEGSFNLTPMIDMVFLLLVFFLAVTTFTKEEVDMSLTLPEAVHGKARGESRLLVINVARDGSLTVDGRSCTMAALHQKLRAAAARNKDQEVLIRGDTQAHFGEVSKALDACIGASLRKVAIAAQPVREPGR
jgi:biopolymer transport protein ExbD